jgi:putative flippase GtrA
MSYFQRLTRLFDRLGLPVPKSLILFVFVGLTGLVVHTLVFSGLFQPKLLSKSAAWLTALVIATIVTWSLNRKLTFAATGRNSGWEIVRYALVTAVSQGVSFGVFMGLSGVFPHLPAQLWLITGAVVATAFSYSGQRFFTFAPAQPIDVVAVGDTPVLVAAPIADQPS